MEQKIDIERAIRDYHNLVKSSRELYDATPEVYCPYFKSNNAGTVQEYRTTLEKWGEPRKDGFSKTKQVEYWGFHDIIGGKPMVLMRIIVRKVGDGKLHFWSVMPIGKIGKQKMYRGDMED